MQPKELIKIWVKHFNDGSADELANLYHLDAINNQVANTPVEAEFSSAEMTCIIENLPISKI